MIIVVGELGGGGVGVEWSRICFVLSNHVMLHTVGGGGCTWVKKRIKRTASRLFLGSEHRGFQLIIV